MFQAILYILLLFYKVVNYDSDNGWTTLLDNFRQTSTITKETEKALLKLKDVDIASITTVQQLGKQINYTNEDFYNFAKQADLTGDILQQYKDYTANATQSTSQFAASLKNIAASALPILAISIIIQLVQAGWDTLNVTVEEQEAKVNSLQAAYQNLQSEYEQLSSKQDLTDAEQKRLSYLERRLELDERILKAEEHQLFKEKTGQKFTDRFDSDNYYTKYQQDTRWDKWGLLSSQCH